MHRHKLIVSAALLMLVLCAPATSGAQTGFVAARLVNGGLPVTPVLAVSGGEVFLEVTVTADGRVDGIRTLRTTPPFTGALIEAVRGWRFTPATQRAEPSTGSQESSGKPVASPVFVAAMFAPPALNGPTLGQPPQDLLSASNETAMPTAATPAAYPPRAVGTGTVLVEVTIDGATARTEARVKVSSPAFDAAAMAAARSWSFLTARRQGQVVTTHAYLLFAFREPVVVVR
jgi:TonB family protein